MTSDENCIMKHFCRFQVWFRPVISGLVQTNIVTEISSGMHKPLCHLNNQLYVSKHCSGCIGFLYFHSVFYCQESNCNIVIQFLIHYANILCHATQTLSPSAVNPQQHVANGREVTIMIQNHTHSFNSHTEKPTVTADCIYLAE